MARIADAPSRELKHVQEIPVPNKLSLQRFTVMRTNIEKMYRSATPEQVRSGQDWYRQAHRFVAERDDPSRGAGVIAALSPGQQWDLNKAQFHQFYATPESHFQQLAQASTQGEKARKATHSELFGGTPLARQSAANILRAYDIRAGANPEDVLPMRKKTGNFYQNIRDPDDPHPVTIDTHAHDIAVGQKYPWKMDRGLSAVGRYGHFADAYRQAAAHLDVPTPNIVQAVTWQAWPRGRAAAQRGRGR